jgi:hypothetical protein
VGRGVEAHHGPGPRTSSTSGAAARGNGDGHIEEQVERLVEQFAAVMDGLVRVRGR